MAKCPGLADFLAVVAKGCGQRRVPSVSADPRRASRAASRTAATASSPSAPVWFTLPLINRSPACFVVGKGPSGTIDASTQL